MTVTGTSDNIILGKFPNQDAPTFRYALEVNKPWGGLDYIVEWCKSEMQDPSWRWQLVESSTNLRPGRYIFYFNNSRDYCAFKLKWS
jgi:hypothetical protein